MKFLVLETLMSNRNVASREYESTKYEVSIVKIPRIVMKGPKERVATSVMEVPRTPMNVAENNI